MAALGHPRRAVGSDDHAVRGRARAERDEIDLAGRRIEPAELAVALGRVPDDAVAADGDVVREAASGGQGIGLHGDFRPRRWGRPGEDDEEREQCTAHGHLLLDSAESRQWVHTPLTHSPSGRRHSQGVPGAMKMGMEQMPWSV